MDEDEFYFRVPREEKTDWKNDVRFALISPRFAYNPWDFMDRVEIAIEIVACTYPNWNAYEEVNLGTGKIIKDYREKYALWCKKNPMVKRTRKQRMQLTLKMEMHRAIWTYLKNYCARHGMLIEGPRDSKSVDLEGESLDVTE